MSTSVVEQVPKAESHKLVLQLHEASLASPFLEKWNDLSGFIEELQVKGRISATHVLTLA
ncbi:uncharacterized protein N7479_005387 [Penicillium vulpinum]|uniref:uncharacterized protein n=1 Tax=Penicillium vulpinum TaxID=29845 RepID=UPI0025475B5F|nr:uncharacterized protein N7479_005387 [Penicillium vulpinum]KAJ5958237.1 hypothetical protein N7479_005387 [Penicillium vulpinum]